MKICTKCIYDEQIPSISFDSNGICSYCNLIQNLVKDNGTGFQKGKKLFEDILEKIKKEGKNKKYNVIIGVSGGTDSSYMLWLAKDLGLRPLAVHYDNTWNSSIATQNISKMVNALNIDLFTYVVDNKEIDDIYRSFFLAGVPEIEASTDLAYAEVLNRVACKYNIKYIFEGHSFVTEGVTPLGNNYFDGKYIKSIHNKFGRLPMKTYPLMTFKRFLKSAIIDKVKKIRPFWYLDYSKEKAQSFLY